MTTATEAVGPEAADQSVGARLFPYQALLLTIGFLVLLAVSVLVVLFVRDANEAEDQVSHTLLVINEIGVLRADIRRAESGVRGFLAIGDADFLRDYRDASAVLGPTIARLRELTADNPRQTQSLNALQPVVEAKQADLAEQVRLGQGGDLAAARARLATKQGLELMASVRTHLVAMLGEERRLLEARRADSERANNLLLVGALGGAVLLAVLAIAAIMIVRRNSNSLVAAREQLANANVRLEQKVLARTADLQEANEEIQRFAYIVSHDLRSPLVNIMGFTAELEALRNDLYDVLPRDADEATRARLGGLQADIDESIGFIKSSIGKMDRLINAILALSRAGKRDFRAEPIDLNDMVANLGKALGHQMHEAQAEIVAGPLPTVMNDRLALEQILSNLLDNAVKYLRTGVPGRIAVTAEDRGAHVALKVTDNGRGIEPRDRQRIFDLFRRAGAQDRPGEGIGLAHVRMLVRRMGGTIGVDGAPGQGTVFTVTLPKVWVP